MIYVVSAFTLVSTLFVVCFYYAILEIKKREKAALVALKEKEQDYREQLARLTNQFNALQKLADRLESEKIDFTDTPQEEPSSSSNALILEVLTALSLPFPFGLTLAGPSLFKYFFKSEKSKNEYKEEAKEERNSMMRNRLRKDLDIAGRELQGFILKTEEHLHELVLKQH